MCHCLYDMNFGTNIKLAWLVAWNQIFFKDIIAKQESCLSYVYWAMMHCPVPCQATDFQERFTFVIP